MKKGPILAAVLIIVVIIVIVVVVLLCRSCQPPPPPEKYALLASTWEATDDNVVANADFWYDLVLTYCTLLEHGFDDENIFVLYGNGSDFQSAVPGYFKPYCDNTVATKITDIPLTDTVFGDKVNLCNVLCCLSTGKPAGLSGDTCVCNPPGGAGIGGFKCTDSDFQIPHLEEADFLLAWIRGHGATEDCSMPLRITFANGTPMFDAEAAGLVAKLRPERRIFYFETCDAGGWMNDFSNDMKTVVVVSSGDPATTKCEETSFIVAYHELNKSTGGFDAVSHGRFSHWINAAFMGIATDGSPIDADADGNNLISVQEDFDAASAEIIGENSKAKAVYFGEMHPAIQSPNGIAPCVFLLRPVPGEGASIFSKKHPYDDGTTTQQQTFAAPGVTPDLWVRHVDDWSEGHQAPRSSFTNHVYARVHNIGCADPGTVEVRFYWAKPDNPDAWNKIGTGSASNLSSGATKLVHAKWDISSQPAPGPILLFAILSTSGDPPTIGTNVESDNNKVRLSTAVVAYP